MSTPLYFQRFLDKKGSTVRVELAITHPDVSDFGTDRLFAWKLLYQWVSPSDEDTSDDVVLASRYVKSVKLSPLENATVAKKAKDFFTVKRPKEGKGKSGKKDPKDPSVVYTIEVTDPSLLSGIKKGDSDDVYDYVEPGRGKDLTTPEKAAVAVAKKPAAAAADSKAGTKTTMAAKYAELRQVTLEGIKKVNGTWSDWIIEEGIFERWVREPSATDQDVKKWLSYLMPFEQVRGAALAGLDRLRGNAKNTASAKDFAKLAESKYNPTDDYRVVAISALAPLWWMLGDKKKAEAGFKRIPERIKAELEKGNSADEMQHLLITTHARAGRWDEVMKLVPTAFERTSSFNDHIVSGVVLAWQDNPKAFDALMKRWSDAIERSSDQCGVFSQQLLRVMIADGKPEAFLECLLAYPKVLEEWQCAPFALVATEQKDPKLAVALGEKILANDDLHRTLHAQSIAIFARHDPKRVEALLKKEKATWVKEKSLALLAAAGCTKEVKTILSKPDNQRDSDEVVKATADRDLAIHAAKITCENARDLPTTELVALTDLGERAYVDALLAKNLKSIEKLATKDRDLRCRYFAKVAAQVGRSDLGFASIKLPGPALRRYTAGDMIEGAASVSDLDTVVAALSHVPEGDANGRVSTAIQSGVRSADNAFFAGPRAVPLSVNHDAYVSGLIAARDRMGILWMQSAHKSRLSDESQVAIDAFLESC